MAFKKTSMTTSQVAKDVNSRIKIYGGKIRNIYKQVLCFSIFILCSMTIFQPSILTIFIFNYHPPQKKYRPQKKINQPKKKSIVSTLQETSGYAPRGLQGHLRRGESNFITQFTILDLKRKSKKENLGRRIVFFLRGVLPIFYFS